MIAHEFDPDETPVGQGNPWLDMAGMWDPEDPLVQEWKEIMAERRREDSSQDRSAQER